MRPFQRLEANPKHVMALQFLTTEDVDIPGVTAFVCLLYGFKTSDIVEMAFLRMSDGKGRDLLYSQFISATMRAQPHQKSTIMWKRADETSPSGDANPIDYRWELNQNCFEPDWFQGSSVLESFTSELTSLADAEATSSDEESDEAWSENDEEV